MGVSASSTAKQLLQLTTTVALCCISNSPISSCPSSLLSYSVVFLWKCNGICGILKYGFQKSQTLAVRSDAEFPLQIPAWQKRIPCQTPPWARCDQHLGKKDGPGIWRFLLARDMVWPAPQETRMDQKYGVTSIFDKRMDQEYGVTTRSRNKDAPEKVWLAKCQLWL